MIPVVNWTRMRFATIGIAVIAADQIGKTWAEHLFATGRGQPRQLGPIKAELVRNPGAAFGLGRGLTFWITLLALAAAAAFVVAGWRTRGRGWATVFGLLAGGTVGNGIDRIARAPGPLHGAVIDWIKLPFYGPVFNLADVALRAGAVLAVVLLLRSAGTAVTATPTTAHEGT